jgi:hypothetical protein
MNERERERVFFLVQLWGEEALKWEFNRQTCHPGLLHNLLLFSENIFFCQAFQREQLKPVL